MLVLIWIEIIGHSDCVPEIIFWKKLILEKKSVDANKNMKACY